MLKLLIGLLCISALPQAYGETPIDVAWLPVTDAERSMKNPVVGQGAGVEALFWRVHVRDEMLNGRELQRVFYHYVRLKVFDEKGKEKASTIELPFTEGFGVDEMPDSAAVASAYGTYRASWKNGNGSVTFEQVLEVKDTLAEAGEYARIKDFFDRVSGGQAAPVVLLKQ